MRTTTYTDARNNFKSLMSKVCEDHAPTIVTNHSTKTEVVVMSLEDYNSMEETHYLMKSPKNAERLLESIEDTKKGKYSKHNLIEE